MCGSGTDWWAAFVGYDKITRSKTERIKIGSGRDGKKGYTPMSLPDIRDQTKIQVKNWPKNWSKRLD